jgi:hypothetical protein
MGWCFDRDNKTGHNDCAPSSGSGELARSNPARPGSGILGGAAPFGSSSGGARSRYVRSVRALILTQRLNACQGEILNTRIAAFKDRHSQSLASGADATIPVASVV